MGIVSTLIFPSASFGFFQISLSNKSNFMNNVKIYLKNYLYKRMYIFIYLYFKINVGTNDNAE